MPFESYGFHVALGADEDPECSLKWRVEYHQDADGPSYVTVRRNAEGKPYATSWAGGAPIARAHADSLFDTHEIASQLRSSDPALLYAEGVSRTAPNRTNLDITVLVRNLVPEGLDVSLACVAPPEHLVLRTNRTWAFMSAGTSDEGYGVMACSDCTNGATLSRGEQLVAEVDGTSGELLFLSSGSVLDGAMTLTHPNGAETWRLPQPGGPDHIRFQGQPGSYDAALDLAKAQSDDSPASYVLAIVGWTDAGTF